MALTNYCNRIYSLAVGVYFGERSYEAVVRWGTMLGECVELSPLFAEFKTDH